MVVVIVLFCLINIFMFFGFGYICYDIGMRDGFADRNYY